MEAKKFEQYYTYKDYIKWETPGELFELIDGVPLEMLAPDRRHQEASGELFAMFHAFLKGKSCKVVSAPFAVRLNANKADDTVVLPDLVVICEPMQLADNKACKGPPTIVIEILSPSTRKHDLTTKFRKYRAAGVGQLWYVDYEFETVEILTLENGKYISERFAGEDKILVEIEDDSFEIEVNEIFI